MSYHPLDKEKPDPNAISNDDLMAIVGGTLRPADIRWRASKLEQEAKRKNILRDPKSYLDREYSTRELLLIHRRGRRGADVFIRGLGEVGYTSRLEEIIREILATRPHIPNKKEGKALRRKAATEHHGKR